MDDNVIELGRHKPSVDSVIHRLERNHDEIKSITAIIEWNDGTSSVAYNTKSMEALTYELFAFQKHLLSLDRDKDGAA